MRAVVEDNEIKRIYKILPKSHVANGFTYVNISKMEECELEAINIYTVFFPEYDRTLQYEDINNVFWNKAEGRAEMPIKDKDLPSVKDAKINTINKVKTDLGILLSRTDWALSRKFEIGKDIPEIISTERLYARTACDNAEIEINTLETIKEVLEYKTRLTDPALDKELM